MICSTIRRRIQKLPLGPQYHQQFLSTLQQIHQKYQSHTLNKALIIKKICTRYLRICNTLIRPSNIPQSIAALQFIKVLQLDIYEGKSYELYPIKITLHLLFVKCLDLQIIGFQKEGRGEEGEKVRKRKLVYVERLKSFVQEIEGSFFYSVLEKDYYANFQLLLFLIVRTQLQTLLHDSTHYVTQTQLTLIEIQSIKKYITKLFEVLKSHIFQLNEMLFYLQKKVYELLTSKVKLMTQLFAIQAQVGFVEKVGVVFSDKQWEVIRRFLEGGGESSEDIDGTRVQAMTKKSIYTSIARNPHTKQSIESKTYGTLTNNKPQFAQEQSFIQKDGGNYRQVSYQQLREKFLGDDLQTLWEKYDSVFSKIPNNIDKGEAFEQVHTIVGSFVHSVEGKSKKVITKKSIHVRGNNTKDVNDCSRDQGSQDEREDGNEIQGPNQNLSVSRNQNRAENKTQSLYKQHKNQQLNDFMAFVSPQTDRNEAFSQATLLLINNKNITLEQNEQRNPQLNESTKKDDTFQSKENIQKQPISQLPRKSMKNVNKILDECQDGNKQNQGENQDCQTDKSQLKPIPKDPSKKSNFKVLQDMKNVFQYICQKHKQNPNQQAKQMLNTQAIQLKNLMKSGKGLMENIGLRLTNEGSKKLNAVKTPTIQLLENIKINEFQRLRRVKSTDLFNLSKMSKSENNFRNQKIELSDMAKGRSQTLYFPFIKESTSMPKHQYSQVFDLPKENPAQSSKIFIFGNMNNTKQARNSKQSLKIKGRSNNKKTTLDIMEIERLKTVLNLKEANEESHMGSFGKVSNQEILISKRTQKSQPPVFNSDRVTHARFMTGENLIVQMKDTL